MMIRQLLFLAGLLMMSNTAADAASFHDLSFLTGCWRGNDGPALTEECWGFAESGLLLGTAKSVDADGKASFEFMRIAETNEGIIFTPFINGREAVSFPVEALGAESVTFANPTHDFPRRITYRRAGEVLAIHLAGANAAGEPMEIGYQLRRLPLP